MNSFDTKHLPDLDDCVLAALELFSKTKLPKVNFHAFKRPMVVGSSNAAITGQIMFEDADAVFADESNYREKLRDISSIDGVFIISASGSKSSIGIAKHVKEKKMKCILLTCNRNSAAAEYIPKNNILVFPKNREPYTYNTSTYMGMMLAKTKENPKKILDFIRSHVDKAIPKDIEKYDAYFFILPEKFDALREMFNKKFVELFGRKIARDFYTTEQAKHSTTIVPSDELLIQFGNKGPELGEKKIVIPLPPKAGYGAMMAIGYYVTGRIQAGKPPYFKQHLGSYCKRASALFRQEITPIVE